MRRPRATTRVLTTIVLIAGTVSCAAPKGDLAARRSRSERHDRSAKEPYALRVGRTLIYPVQHQRAEDLAETIAALVEPRGGRVSVDPASNHLLIWLPDPSDARERAPGAIVPAPAPR